MTAFVLVAYVWGLIQLLVIASPSRTVRCRVLFLAFLSGMYVSSIAALFVEQLWIRVVAIRTDQLIFDVTRQAAVTASPFIEEVAKLLPLLLILCWARVRRRLGVTDVMLIGAALGAGFGFAEATMGLVHVADTAIWDSLSGNWIVFFGLSSKQIPGILNTIEAWLPVPLGKGIVFDTAFLTFAGLRLELMDYNYHLVWSALAALGVGLFVRAPRKRWSWPALVLVPWVGAVHAFENFAQSQPAVAPAWRSLITLAGAVGGFGRAMSVFVLIGLVTAVLVDRRRIARALSDEDHLQWGGESRRPLIDPPSVKGALSLLRRFTLRGVGMLKAFILERRSYAFLKSLSPDPTELERWRVELASRRALLEDEHKVQQLRSTLGRVVDRLRANKRFRLLVGLQILLILLFLVPAATYLFVSVFPSTQALQAFFELPIIFSILKGLTMLGVLLLVARLFFFYRFLPVLKRLQGGQGLAGYLLGGIVAHGALLLGLIALLLAFQGRPTQELLDLLNLAQWAEFLTAVLSVALFVLGVGLLIFSGLGVLAVPAEVLFGIKVAELLLDIYTIADLVIESQHDGLYALERLELSLAIYSLLLFPLAIPGAIPMPAVARWVLEGTDAVLGGEQVWVEFQGPRETDWSLPNRTCTLFNHIRQGDRALRNHQPGQALRSYGEARHLTAQVRTTPLTRGVIMTRIGDTLRSQGDDHGALVAYQDALDQMPSAGVLPEYQANLHVRIGDLHVREEDYPAAIQSYQSALELYQAAGADAMQVSEAMLKLGESWLHAGDTDRAVQFLRESLELMTRAGKASRERAALFERLGDGFLATSDPEQAAQCFQLGIEDYQALGSPLAEGLLGRLDALQ